VRFLLDTHTFLWAVLDDPRLSDKVRALMLNADNELLVSPASYWEIAIKISLGKYTLDDDFEAFMERQTVYSEFTLLPISLKHAAVVASLPFHHRDPFDRLLVAQAISEGIPIVSIDRALDLYPLTRIW
jgi:PIN domain nuclease of toxin-antitoxin system